MYLFLFPSSAAKDRQKQARNTRRTEVLQEETKRRRVNVEVSSTCFLFLFTNITQADWQELTGCHLEDIVLMYPQILRNDIKGSVSQLVWRINILKRFKHRNSKERSLKSSVY